MRGVGGGAQLLEELRDGIVLDAQPALLHDHVALGQELLVGDLQVRETVGLEIDDDADAVAGEHREVGRVVLRRERVGAPAVALDDLAVLLRRDGLGPLERDVLEDVREPV
jgi:hypothetical protein